MKTTTSPRAPSPASLVVLLVVGLLGCGDSGIPRYRVSGAVTFNGQPVPAGEVVFQPDASQGNKGPGSVALIKSGRYETASGKGVIGGPYVIRIAGFNGVPVGDSSVGTSLFPPYQTSINLAKKDATQDFAVPARSKAGP
jgi:hypothetical protein